MATVGIKGLMLDLDLDDFNVLATKIRYRTDAPTGRHSDDMMRLHMTSHISPPRCVWDWCPQLVAVLQDVVCPLFF